MVRASVPTVEDWDAIRPIFTQLYRDENQSLRDVQLLLAEQHGFHATTKTFKKRIEKWQIRKNYRAVDMRRAVDELEAATNAGRSPQEILINGKPMDFNRLRRHPVQGHRVRMLRGSIQSETIDRNSQTASSTLRNRHSTHRAQLGDELEGHLSSHLSHLPVCRPLELPQFLHNVDKVLRCISVYYSHLLECRRTDDLSPQKETSISGKSVKLLPLRRWLAFEFSDKVYCGRYYLETGQHSRAFTLFHQACKLIKPMLLEQQRNLIRYVLESLATVHWAQYTDIQDQFLRFIASMAMTVLGPDHLLGRILHQFQSQQTLYDAAEPAFTLMIDVINRQESNPQEKGHGVREDLIKLLSRRQNFESAVNQCTKLLEDSTRHFGELSVRTLRVRRTLGEIYYIQHRYEEAEQIWLEVLNLETKIEETDDGSMRQSCDRLYTIEVIAHVLQVQGKFAQSEVYYVELLLEWLSREEETDHAIDALRNLEIVLVQQEKWDDVEVLHERYKHLFERDAESVHDGIFDR